MDRKIPKRFWFEAVLAAVGLILFVVTLVSREWIELLTGWDADAGNGSVELIIACALPVISAASMLAARRDFQRSTTPA